MVSDHVCFQKSLQLFKLWQGLLGSVSYFNTWFNFLDWSKKIWGISSGMVELCTEVNFHLWSIADWNNQTQYLLFQLGFCNTLLPNLDNWLLCFWSLAWNYFSQNSFQQLIHFCALKWHTIECNVQKCHYCFSWIDEAMLWCRLCSYKHVVVKVTKQSYQCKLYRQKCRVVIWSTISEQCQIGMDLICFVKNINLFLWILESRWRWEISSLTSMKTLPQ